MDNFCRNALTFHPSDNHLYATLTIFKDVLYYCNKIVRSMTKSCQKEYINVLTKPFIRLAPGINPIKLFCHKL